MKYRIIFTGIVAFFLYTLISTYNAMMPSIEAKVAVGQVNDSIVEYSLIQAFMQSHMGKPLIYIVCIIVIFAIWWKPIKASCSAAKNDE